MLINHPQKQTSGKINYLLDANVHTQLSSFNNNKAVSWMLFKCLPEPLFSFRFICIATRIWMRRQRLWCKIKYLLESNHCNNDVSRVSTDNYGIISKFYFIEHGTGLLFVQVIRTNSKQQSGHNTNHSYLLVIFFIRFVFHDFILII